MRTTPATLLHRLYLWNLDSPDSPAHYFKDEQQHWKSISVHHFWLQVVRIAQSLKSSGFEKGDRVMIYAMNSPEWIQWELGVILAGGMSVGIHPNTSQPELEKILAELNPKFAIVESALYRDRISNRMLAAEQVLTFKESLAWMASKVSDDSALLIAQGNALLDQLNPIDSQILIYTSGTTGDPKGVMLNLRNLSFTADCLAREWNLIFGDGFLFSFLPLSHVAEKVQSIAVALTLRYPVWFNSKYDRFVQELKEVRPTLFLAVPRIWERIREQVENHKPKLLRHLMEFEKLGPFAEKIYLIRVKEQLGLDRLKLAVSGAAKLPPSVASWFKGLGIEIQEIYGMSETSGMVTLTKAPRTQFNRVGKAPLATEVKISPEGEIWVRGDHVFQGYYQKPKETDQILLPEGWLKTGDLGEWDSETQELNIIGRSREIIKLSNGRMVAPLPIESVLKEIPEISNVCVVGEGHSTLLALISLKESVLMEYKFIPGAIEGLAVADEKIKQKIRDQIDHLVKNEKIFEKISRLVILSREFSIDQKEMTSTQKLNRNVIQKNFYHFIELAYQE